MNRVNDGGVVSKGLHKILYLMHIFHLLYFSWTRANSFQVYLCMYVSNILFYVLHIIRVDFLSFESV